MNDVILFISGSEIFIIVLAILILFGAKKIPEFAKGLGQGIKEFRKATQDIKKEIHDTTSGIADEVNEIKKDLKKDFEN